MACGLKLVLNVLIEQLRWYSVRFWGENPYQKVEMIGKVYMMLCERARPAGIEVALARSSRKGTFANYRIFRTKSNGNDRY